MSTVEWWSIWTVAAIIAAVVLLLTPFIYAVLLVFEFLAREQPLYRDTYGSMRVVTVKLKKPAPDPEGRLRFFYETRTIGPTGQRSIYSERQEEALANHYNSCRHAK